MLIQRAVSYAQRKIETLVKPNPENQLFRGDDELFINAIRGCTVYGEYGCGASTIWCAQNTEVRIFAVDSSTAWIETVLRTVGQVDRLQTVHVDIGSLGPWGRPIDYSKRNRFSDYIEAPWQFDAKPDVILVDGRFRVACFLKSLIEAEPGSTILFDDYTERANYHVVEEFVEHIDTCGTQAKFIVPDSIEREAIECELAGFTYVMD